ILKTPKPRIPLQDLKKRVSFHKAIKTKEYFVGEATTVFGTTYEDTFKSSDSSEQSSGYTTGHITTDDDVCSRATSRSHLEETLPQNVKSNIHQFDTNHELYLAKSQNSIDMEFTEPMNIISDFPSTKGHTSSICRSNQETVNSKSPETADLLCNDDMELTEPLLCSTAASRSDLEETSCSQNLNLNNQFNIGREFYVPIHHNSIDMEFTEPMNIISDFPSNKGHTSNICRSNQETVNSKSLETANHLCNDDMDLTEPLLCSTAAYRSDLEETSCSQNPNSNNQFNIGREFYVPIHRSSTDMEFTEPVNVNSDFATNNKETISNICHSNRKIASSKLPDTAEVRLCSDDDDMELTEPLLSSRATTRFGLEEISCPQNSKSNNHQFDTGHKLYLPKSRNSTDMEFTEPINMNSDLLTGNKETINICHSNRETANSKLLETGKANLCNNNDKELTEPLVSQINSNSPLFATVTDSLYPSSLSSSSDKFSSSENILMDKNINISNEMCISKHQNLIADMEFTEHLVSKIHSNPLVPTTTAESVCPSSLPSSSDKFSNSKHNNDDHEVCIPKHCDLIDMEFTEPLISQIHSSSIVSISTTDSVYPFSLSPLSDKFNSNELRCKDETQFIKISKPDTIRLTNYLENIHGSSSEIIETDNKIREYIMDSFNESIKSAPLNDISLQTSIRSETDSDEELLAIIQHSRYKTANRSLMGNKILSTISDPKSKVTHLPDDKEICNLSNEKTSCEEDSEIEMTCKDNNALIIPSASYIDTRDCIAAGKMQIENVSSQELDNSNVSNINEFKDNLKSCELFNNDKLGVAVSNDSTMEFTNVSRLAQVTVSNDSTMEFTNVSCLPQVAVSKDSTMELTNVSRLAQVTVSNDSTMEFTNVSRLAQVAVSNYSTMEFTNVSCLPQVAVSNDSTMEFTNVSRLAQVAISNDSTKEFTNVSHLPQVAVSNDSTMEFTNVIHSPQVAVLNDSTMEFTNVSHLPQVAVSNDSTMEFTNVIHSPQVTVLNDSTIKFTNVSPLPQVAVSNDSTMEFTNVIHSPQVAVLNDSTIKFTNVSPLPQVAVSNDSTMEFTNVIHSPQVAVLNDSTIKFTNVSPLPQVAVSNDSTMEFTNVSRLPQVAISNDSTMEFTNVSHIPQVAVSNDSTMEFTNVSHLPQVAVSNDSTMEFTNVSHLPQHNYGSENDFSLRERETSLSNTDTNVKLMSKNLEKVENRKEIEILKSKSTTVTSLGSDVSEVTYLHTSGIKSGESYSCSRYNNEFNEENMPMHNPLSSNMTDISTLPTKQNKSDINALAEVEILKENILEQNTESSTHISREFAIENVSSQNSLKNLSSPNKSDVKGAELKLGEIELSSADIQKLDISECTLFESENIENISQLSTSLLSTESVDCVSMCIKEADTNVTMFASRTLFSSEHETGNSGNGTRIVSRMSEPHSRLENSVVLSKSSSKLECCSRLEENLNKSTKISKTKDMLSETSKMSTTKENITETTAISVEDQIKALQLRSVEPATKFIFLKPNNEWFIKELSETCWSFLFMSKIVELLIRFDKSASRTVSDIELISHATDDTDPLEKFVHKILLRELPAQRLKLKCKQAEDVVEILKHVITFIKKINRFKKDILLLQMTEVAEFKNNRFVFDVSEMAICLWFHVKVNLNHWDGILPEDVSVENEIGEVCEHEVKQLATSAVRGPGCLFDYVKIVNEYVEVLRVSASR
ncbi:hypothetical protein L9F63_005854, partial [Diploptera punctata]